MFSLDRDILYLLSLQLLVPLLLQFNIRFQLFNLRLKLIEFIDFAEKSFGSNAARVVLAQPSLDLCRVERGPRHRALGPL